jgi:hypothetical protein
LTTDVTESVKDAAPVDAPTSNSDFPWDNFDTDKYLDHNYHQLRDDDAQIVEIVGAYFAEKCADWTARSGLRGIDVGTGANLYPTLAMLPFCDQIRLLEFSASNCAWLKQQHTDDWPSWPDTWKNFWDVLCRRPEYGQFTGVDMGRELSRRTEVVQGSVLELEVRREEAFDIGTMFFVAESISPQHGEFSTAMRLFLDALREGAPFAIALMEHSKGYQVGDNHFPATDIDTEDVREFLGGSADDVVVERVGPGDNPLRDGYTAMIIACGRARGKPLS